MSVLPGPVAAERGPGRAITRPERYEAHSGPQEPTTGDPRAVRGPYAAAGGRHSASQRLAGSGRRPGAENAPEGRSWPAVRPSRPGAPLILPGATLAEALAALPTPPKDRPRLTFAQAEALTLVADGLTYRQIARRLFVSEVAIRRRMVRAFRRLGVHGKAAAVRAGIEAGILDPTGGPR